MTDQRNNVWRAVIVDDERLARARMRSLLAAHPEIEIAGEADGVAAALAVIHAVAPDVIFLDIQLPGASGFDLVNQLNHPAHIIFVTAFDEHALRAFEVNALDYLLKPVTPERLAKALARLQQPSESPAPSVRLLAYDDSLFLATGAASRFLRVNAIKCIIAADAYSEITTTENQRLLVHKPLSEWEERLPARHFIRIHRATIVNLACVERVEPWFNAAYQVHLRGLAEPLLMSRRYAARLKERMG
jgi:two-component system LytT family response regulator